MMTPNLFKSYCSWEYVLASEKIMVYIYDLIEINIWYGVIRESVSSSVVWLFVTPWTIPCQAPLSMGFSRQQYSGGLPFPSPEDLPNPGTEPGSPALAGRVFTIWGTSRNLIKIHTGICRYALLQLDFKCLRLSNAKRLRAKFSKWYLLHIHISTQQGKLEESVFTKEDSIRWSSC